MNETEIKAYLDDYIRQPKPDFAVMITGQWGTGKTYFIKKYIEGENDSIVFNQDTLPNEQTAEIDKQIAIIRDHKTIAKEEIELIKADIRKVEKDIIAVENGKKKYQKQIDIAKKQIDSLKKKMAILGEAIAIVEGQSKNSKKQKETTGQKRKKEKRKKAIYISLYGIKSKTEIENQLWIQLLRNKLFYIPIIIVFVAILVAVVIGCCKSISNTEMIVNLVFHSLGIIIISIIIWFYTSLKFFFLSCILGKTGLIVFDDFERASVSYELLMAYLNRYVEHLHKHVVIICNEDEIEKKEVCSLYGSQTVPPLRSANINDIKTASSDSSFALHSEFQRLKEKIVGQTILFEQNDSLILNNLLNNSNYTLLKFIAGISFEKKSFLLSSSRPQSIPVNYRVWFLCCREFERVFGGVSYFYLEKKPIIMELIPQFFSLVYSLFVRDFGDGRVFTDDTAMLLFVKRETNERFTWFYELFSFRPHSIEILPPLVWEKIIRHQTINIESVQQHWDVLLDSDNGQLDDSKRLWHRVHSYITMTDNEVMIVWKHIKQAYLSRSIHDPAQITSIYSSVDDMIRNKCCPQKKLTRKVLLKCALRYIESVELLLSPSLEDDLDSVFYSCELFPHRKNRSKYFYTFQKKFKKKLHNCIIDIFVSKRFETLLSLLDNERSFGHKWFVTKMKDQIIFEKQSPKKLLNRLIELPPSLFSTHLDPLLNHIFYYRRENNAYLEFEKGLLSSIKKVILQEKQGLLSIDKSKFICLNKARRKIINNLNDKTIHLNR